MWVEKKIPEMDERCEELWEVAAFYRFMRVEEPVLVCDELRNWLRGKSIVGSVLIAGEGVNATVASASGEIPSLLEWLSLRLGVSEIPSKRSFCSIRPFRRMKVRLKKEIVSLGVEEIDPTQEVGVYVAPKEWNALIARDDVTVIDTRNIYEYRLGTFEGAVDPKTESFREFPGYVDLQLDPERQPRVAMFCTGGIRCEKATSLLLKRGFREVFHLEGGILNYLEQIPPSESLWRGSCFVFDERVSVEHGLVRGHHRLCRTCGNPLDEAEPCGDRYEDRNCCPYCS
jgi:UPF0176 protein